MKTVQLIYNTILAGKFYTAGDPIEESLLSPNLRKYIAKPENGRRKNAENLMLRYNERYSVDQGGFLKPSVGRQASQLQADAYAQDVMTDELAEAEVSPAVAEAIEEAREDYRADVEKQKTQARVKAERQEQAEEFLRQEQNASVESGELDQWDAEARRDSPEREGRGASVRPKLIAKRNSYVRRGYKFIPADRADLVEGERLYWFRQRKFGQKEKWIPFAKVERRKEN